MQLSELVYNIVKNVKYLEDRGFTRESFIHGDYDNDSDYANSINNAFAPLNEAIHRLSDLNKISNIIEKLPSPNNNGIVSLNGLNAKIKKIVNIFILQNGKYTHVEYREFGRDKIFLINYFSSNDDLYIEYIQDIPHFSKDNIYYFEDNINVIEQRDVDLEQYGINDTMCSYIIEYCQGKLLEPIAPELANMHLSRSEQYFSNLDNRQTSFNQNIVKKVYGIDEL